MFPFEVDTGLWVVYVCQRRSVGKGQIMVQLKKQRLGKWFPQKAREERKREGESEGERLGFYLI